MKFYLPTLKAPTPDVPAAKAHYAALGARCWECPLAKHAPVPSQWTGKGLPPLAIVGEAPGRREIAHRLPFIGMSGKVLNYACSQAGIERGRLAVLNAIVCGPIPSEQDAVKKRALECCRPRLIAELRALRPRVVLALGALALKSIAPEGSSGVTALRGAKLDLAEDFKTSTWQPEALFSTYHPAHIARGGDGEEQSGDKSVDALYYFLLFDLAKAWAFANGEAREWGVESDLFVDHEGALHRVVVEGEPRIGGRATERELFDALGRVYEEAKAHGSLTCDVETDHKDSMHANLTAIGYGTPEGGLCATWNAYQMFDSVARLLLEIHGAGIRWNWQNGIYDRVVLRRHKLRGKSLRIRGNHEDTLLAHHAAFPGLPHRLDSIASQFHVIPPWKNEFRTSTRNLAELVHYCVHDVVMTARLEPAIKKHVKLVKTERVYEADRQLNVIATEMRLHGCYVDVKEQERHRAIQTARLEYMRNSLQKEMRDLEGPWREALARLQADKQRKGDPDSFIERVRMRHQEIANRKSKATDIGFFKPKAKLDIVALFNVLKIPVKAWTKTGLPVTDKKAMDAAAARHPLMRRLIHLREAQHLIANYVDLPIDNDGRMHPDWKALDVTTPILTLQGWKTMGTVAVGDKVFAPDGTPTAVTYISPISTREGFRVVFDDHAEVIADRAHLWPVFKQGRADQWRVVATEQLTRRLRLPRPAALQGLEAVLPIDPYVMGAWLGDGAKATGRLYYAASDRDVPNEFARRGYQASTTAKDPRTACESAYYPRLQKELRRAGFLGTREIPAAYLVASKAQRFDLLQGLLDTDGSVSLRGQVSFSATREKLAQQVLFLARSLGYRAGICESKARIRGRVTGRQFQVFWEGWGPTFGMARKQARIRRTCPPIGTRHRWVTLIEPVGTRDVRCIAVDHPSHCYVVGRALIVTHNTNKITGRWGAGRSQNVPNDVSSWPPKVGNDGEFARDRNGDYVCDRDNLRSLFTAPTAEQIIEVAARSRDLVDPWVLGRAKQGFGRMLVGADEDQVELRIVGFLSREPFLLKIFNEGRDPHSEFARSVIFPREFPKLEETIAKAGFKPKATQAVDDEIAKLVGREDDIARVSREKLRDVRRAQAGWKRLRDLSKRAEYGSLYRGEAPTLWESIVKDFPELQLTDVENMLRSIHEAMPRVVAWWAECDEYARRHREIRETWLGRVRLFPLGNFDPTVAVNFPVQARNAGLMATATFRFIALTRPEWLEFEPLYRMKLLDAQWVNARRDEGFARWRSPVCPILQVHDSLVAECDEEDADQVVKLLTLCMDQEDYDSKYDVRMKYTGEARKSRRWSKT